MSGSSIGALIGLDLIARHADDVRVVVAHEPPAWQLLPPTDRDRATRSHEEAEETFRLEGADAAVEKFVALAAVDLSDREPDAALAAPTSQRAANLSFFFTYDSPAVRRYQLDLAAIQASAARIVPAVGQSAAESAPYRAATALATRLEKRAVEFPAVLRDGSCAQGHSRRSLRIFSNDPSSGHRVQRRHRSPHRPSGDEITDECSTDFNPLP